MASASATASAATKDSSSSDAAATVPSGGGGGGSVTGAGDIGPCPLLEAERIFPTCMEFDLPPPVAGHCLGLRLPR